ncbi:MAG: hypothetical protein K2G88_09645 [Oscillospiraceae bacterium]|nr:hypothetical protein [Oscillospiraceae bacterium]
MVWCYGRTRNKECVHDYVSKNTLKKTTLVSSDKLEGTQAYGFFQGFLKGQNFLNYIKNTLVPALKKGDIVVIDNLAAIK